MKLKTFIILSAAALSLTAVVPEPAEAHSTGYRHRHNSRNQIGPMTTTRYGNTIVRERMYGNCYGRSVTTIDRYGRKRTRHVKRC